MIDNPDPTKITDPQPTAGEAAEAQRRHEAEMRRFRRHLVRDLAKPLEPCPDEEL